MEHQVPIEPTMVVRDKNAGRLNLKGRWNPVDSMESLADRTSDHRTDLATDECLLLRSYSPPSEPIWPMPAGPPAPAAVRFAMSLAAEPTPPPPAPPTLSAPPTGVIPPILGPIGVIPPPLPLGLGAGRFCAAGWVGGASGAGGFFTQPVSAITAERAMTVRVARTTLNTLRQFRAKCPHA